jgi:hypothetical protein
MIVDKLNTAKGLRRSDKWPMTYILLNSPKRLAVAFPETEQESSFVHKTSPLSGKKFALHARKPLRRIVARTPESYEKAPGYILTHYIDTLECGHQITTYSGEESKKKRGCQDCLDAQIAAKKPAQSVTGRKVA